MNFIKKESDNGFIDYKVMDEWFDIGEIYQHLTYGYVFKSISSVTCEEMKEIVKFMEGLK